MTDFTFAAERAITTAPGDQSLSQVAPLAGGGYVVAWVSWSSVDGQNFGTVFAQTFDAGGTATAAPVQLFGDTAGTSNGYVLGGLAGLADGGFVASASVMQLDPAGVANPVVQVVSRQVAANGELAAPDVIVAEGPYENGSWPSAGEVHALPDGGYFVEIDRFYKPTPQSDHSTEMQRFDAGGTPLGTAFHVASDAWQPPSVSLLPDGGVVGALWSPNFSPTIPVGWNLVAPDGSVIATGYESVPGTFNQRPLVVALADGTFVLAWLHEPSSSPDPAPDPWVSGWNAQRFDGSGQPVGSVFAFAVPEGLTAFDLLPLSDGGFLLWGARDSTYVGQHFDATGQPAGDVFQIGAAVSDIVATSDGGFLVSYSPVGDISGADVYLREFDVASMPLPGQRIQGGEGIDDLHGTAGNDTLEGGNGKDLLFGDAGDDRLDGGNGVDTAVYTGPRSAYTIAIGEDGVTLSGPEGTDHLVDVERVKFSDAQLALDIHGAAGMAWRLYQAAFDRVPDLPGLGYQMNALDEGQPLWHVAGHFLESPEFQSTYGGLDAQAFVTQLYENVLQREPEAAGLAYHLARMEAGATRADILVGFSESPENQAKVVGSIEGGMAYVA